MKSNYKRLGDYIEPCDLLNDKEELTLLQGISNEKYFQGCKSNTNDIDLSRYRICRKGWFAYNRATTRNGDKISIAYRDEQDCLVSPSYKCFRIKDETLLNPYYLLLWFKRPQFDRYARFKSHGSAHEYFEYEEMCDVELPIPDIEEQKKIVQSYKVIENRISILRQINDNLVETGKVVLNRLVGSIDLVSKTDIEINEVILPDGFTIKSIKEFCADMKSGSTPSRSNNLYWENGDIAWLKSGEVHNNITISTEEYITPLALKESSTKILPQNTVLMAMYGVTAGEVGYLAIPATTNQAICGMICKSKQESAFLYFTLLANQNSISRQATGGAQSNLSKEFIEKIKIVIPTQDILENNEFVFILDTIQTNTYEISSLINLQNIILGQLSSH